MKSKKAEFKEISVSLMKIQDCKFYYNLDFKCDKDELEEGKLPYSIIIKHQISYDLQNDLFYINLSVGYEDKNNLILEAENRFTFHVKGLKNIIKIKSGSLFSLDVDFLPTLINIAIGTMRGVIYSRTGSSPLSEIPLPMISIEELMGNTTLNSAD